MDFDPSASLRALAKQSIFLATGTKDELLRYARNDAEPSKPIRLGNMTTRAEFLSRYKDIFEHSPWIVECAYDRGGDFLEAAHAVLAEASDDERLSLIRAHPELAANIELTAASTAEQTGAGLRALTAEEFETFSNLNAQYRQKFGFPFVICVREHTKASILENFAARLHNDAAAEQQTALAEIMKIAALRLQAR